MTQQQIDALSVQIKNLMEANFRTQAQLDLLTEFAYITVKSSSHPHAIAAQMRDSIREVLAERAGQPDQDYESALTLALAAFLEAAGKPPQR